MTPRMHDCLAFIQSFMVDRPGVSPSYDEIGAAIGIKSKSGVSRLVHSLIERGYLRQEGGRNRQLMLITPPKSDWLAGYITAFEHLGRTREQAERFLIESRVAPTGDTDTARSLDFPPSSDRAFSSSEARR